MANLTKIVPVVKRAFPWNKVLIGTASVGALGGATTIGYKWGERSGATQAANAMTNAFTAANQVENQQIAENYYEQGLEDALNKTSSLNKGVHMDKQAVLEQVYNEAFNDELCKIAGIGDVAKAAWKPVANLGKTIGGSFKNLGQHIGRAAKHGYGAAGEGKATASLALNERAALSDAMKKAKKMGSKQGQEFLESFAAGTMPEGMLARSEISKSLAAHGKGVTKELKGMTRDSKAALGILGAAGVGGAGFAAGRSSK